DEQLVVNKLSPSIATKFSASSIDVKQSAHDSATLSGATADAGGTVTYTVYTDNTCSSKAVAGTDIDAQPAAVTVTNGSVPDSAAVQFLKAGTYYWQASYSDDGNITTARTTDPDEQLVVNKLS